MERTELEDCAVEIYRGEAEEVWEVLRAKGWRRPLVVCGRTVSKQAWFGEWLERAGGAAEVFAEVEPDPSDETVARGGEVARSCGADCVVGIGGGSSMDAAKAIAAEAPAPGWVAEQNRPGQPPEVPHQPLPVVCIPTTAGTGSEVTPFCVITYRADARKLALKHDKLRPAVAFLDARLLATAPRMARVAAGIDALTHAVESHVSKLSTEATRRRTREAIELIGGALEGACLDEPEASALGRMQWAALLAGVAFSQTRLGIVHAMALPVSALFGAPHGIANAILLPYGMRFNWRWAIGGYAEIAELLGAGGGSAEEKAEAAAGAVRKLCAAVGAPLSLKEVGVEEASIPRMAADAIKSPHIEVNPRPLTEENLAEVYRQALEGCW